MKNPEKQEEKKENATEEDEDFCPVCGDVQIIIAGRCATCLSCGWSLCSM